MTKTRVRDGAALGLALLLVSCGGGGGVSAPPSITVPVQISWDANRETAVNRTGGGYRVYYSRTAGFDISGASFVDVPFTVGPATPTSADLMLSSGSNFIKVVGYSDLKPSGGAPSGEITVNVPFGGSP